jgi:shikimate kinase/3-dehydroquinate synthase
MAAGKSTIGRLVAADAQVEFVDLDERIAARAGVSVSEIFSREGEAGFRERERVELAAVLARGTPCVVALGGGALLNRETRLTALERATVVTLFASTSTIVRRAAAQGGRPLLEGDNAALRVQELLELRANAYAEAHARLSSEGAPEDVARAVREVWDREPIAVAAGQSSYAVDVGTDLFQARVRSMVRPSTLALYASDQNVMRHHGERIRAAFSGAHERTAEVVLEPGEQHKTIATVELIWRRALESGADRSSVFVGLGGGVVTDITGFAAASWMRGVRWVAIPTTLLAHVDASVGGKTGVDLASAKNAVGAFWQPSAVLCDVAFLTTEPERGFISALSEVVKTALIGDPSLLELLEVEAPRIRARETALIEEIVRRCVRVKASIVSRDERESGLRATLNLGHTVGHALEAFGGYTALTHGEAVSLGLVAALRLGERLGYTPSDLSGRIVALLTTLGLPSSLANQPLAAAADLVGHDKKRAGAAIRFVFARAAGVTEPVEVGLDDLRREIRSLGAPA